MLIYIIIGLLILGVIGALLEWLGEHKGLIIGIIIFAICCYFFGEIVVKIIFTIIGIGIAGCFFAVPIKGVYECIQGFIKRRNEKELMIYLNENCIRCGYVDRTYWRELLPEYVSKSYETSFEEITNRFAWQVEEKYIRNDKEIEWLNPAMTYLINNVIADVVELEKVPSENLKYTHITPNGKLIHDAMESLCSAKIVNGKPMVQKIVLEDSAVRKSLKLQDGKEIPSYYKVAYKIMDSFAKKRKNNKNSNIESEEISLDDL